MKLTTYFIKHPIISLVLNAMLMILGFLCWQNISVREYPNVVLPVVSVRTIYPNASAQLVESKVTNPLEDQLADVSGLKSMTSQSLQNTSDIKLKFIPGTSLDQAMIAIREAIGLARSQLPIDVKEPTIERGEKSLGPPFIGLAVSSETLDYSALTHFVHLSIKNAFRSIKGVASVEVWGAPYTMRVTLDPKKMYAFGVNADQIRKVLEANNIALPVGKFRNETPATLTLRLESIEDFENLVLKEQGDQTIYLKSVAHIALESNRDDFRIKIDGKPGVIVAIQRTNMANPISVSADVRETVKKLKKQLPENIQLELNLDQSDFIRDSLKNIKHSIVEAIILVLIIVFLFLRNWHATLIPLITIPISLMGSMILIKLFGFSINTITLLAMVLAIGLVVDDAIVILENIVRFIEKGLAPIEAAIQGAREIGFAVVAMTLTLASVFIPIAFVQGVTGQLFVEFAVALAGSVFVSGIVALTLTPMMCGNLIQAKEKRWFPVIDVFLKKLEIFYTQLLEKAFHYTNFVLIAAGVILGLTVLLFYILPTEMAPKEDRGLVGIFVPPTPGETFDDLEKKLQVVETALGDVPEARSRLAFVGDWGGNVVFSLKPHQLRKRSANEIVRSMMPFALNFPSQDVWPWSWDAGLPGMDQDMGRDDLELSVSTSQSYRDLLHDLDQAKKHLDDQKRFRFVKHNLDLDRPSYEIHLDHNKLSKLGLTTEQVAKTIEIFFSGQKSLDFQKSGVNYPITIQANEKPWSLDPLYLTNPQGERVSLGGVAQLTPSTTAGVLKHYNQMRSAILSAKLNAKQKMGEAMADFWAYSAQVLPDGLKKEWVGRALAYQEAAHTILFLFVMALVFIYAILVVQFEDWIDPLIVMFTVPLACFGGLLLAWLCGQSLNIFTQIGLITLIGLITKHGILMVEFASQLKRTGKTYREAIQAAAQLRLRPILMTTGAMVLGMLPLLFSIGAGSEARHGIGVILVGGLLLGTCFTLWFLPVFYDTVKNLVAAIPNRYRERRSAV